jgi:hypothetical protein
MKLPTLSQVHGFTMIVNTLLPAIVVVTLGAMAWSTAAAMKRNACATVGHLSQAMNDRRGEARYVAARGQAKEAALAELLARLDRQPPPADGSCGAWQELRARVEAILTNEIYAETVARIEHELNEVDRKLQKAKNDVQRVVPRIEPIKLPGVPGVDQAVAAVNESLKVVRGALARVGAALSTLGQAISEPFDTAGRNLQEEARRVDYKRAVAFGLVARFASDTVDSFAKFGWFFVALALWLVLSYALWAHRRLAEGWALLLGREAARSGAAQAAA